MNTRQRKTKRPTVRPNRRTLATLGGAIRNTLKNDTANILKRGALLLEAKEQVAHGEWEQWLNSNFELDERTARRAMAASRFVATLSKSDSVSVLNMAVSVLYDLVERRYNEDVLAAILKEIKTKYVTAERARQIETSIWAVHRDRDEAAEAASEAAKSPEQIEAEDEATRKSIKDELSHLWVNGVGTPLTAAQIVASLIHHADFSQLVLALKSFAAKPANSFVGKVAPDELATAHELLGAVLAASGDSSTSPLHNFQAAAERTVSRMTATERHQAVAFLEQCLAMPLLFSGNGVDDASKQDEPSR